MQFKDYIAQLPAYKPGRLTDRPTQDVVKLSSNENVLGPAPRALAALHGALADIHLYPDSSAASLRAALADRYGLTPELVLCSNGSEELILLLCLGLLREGDEAVMAQGTFISYLLRTVEMGGHAIRVPLRSDYAHDLPAMLAAITPRTRLLFICNPNNPTGTTMGHDDLAALLAAVPDHVLVVADEAYIEYATRADYPDLLPELRAGRSNLILLRTFAKIYGLAGLRLGYAFGPAQVIDYLNRARPVFNVNGLAQVAGLAALDDDDHVQRSRAYAAQCRDYFAKKLAALGLYALASETNFVAVPVGDDAAVAEGLRARGFLVTPLAGWGVPGHIRISFGTQDQNERFFAALGEVVQAIGTHTQAS